MQHLLLLIYYYILLEHKQEEYKVNINKSIKLALAHRSMTPADIALAMGTTTQRVYALTNQKVMRSDTIERLAKAFNYKTSEFIALGEE